MNRKIREPEGSLAFLRICCASKVEVGQILVFLGRGHGRKGRHQRGLLLENILIEVVDEITFVKAEDGSGACISHISLRVRAMVEPIYKLQAVFPQTFRGLLSPVSHTITGVFRQSLAQGRGEAARV